MSDDKPEPKKPAAKRPATARKPAAKKPAAKKPGAAKKPATQSPAPAEEEAVEAPVEAVAVAESSAVAEQAVVAEPAPAAEPAESAEPGEPAEPAGPAEPPAPTAEPAKRKRRRWPWILGGVLAGLVILGVIAFFVADNYAKDYARDYIKQRIVAVLGIDEDTPVTVDIGDGSVLLQALRGSLDNVDVTAGKVTFGELTGAATVHAEGVPLDENAATRTLRVTFSVAEADVAALAGNLSGLELKSITLEEPEIVATTEIDVFGLFTLPVGMGLEPSAVDGQIVFTPTSIRLGDENFTADEVRQQFGVLGEQLLQQQSLCVDEKLPVALTVVDVDVVGKELVLAIDGDGVVLGGSDLSTFGTCGG